VWQRSEFCTRYRKPELKHLFEGFFEPGVSDWRLVLIGSMLKTVLAKSKFNLRLQWQWCRNFGNFGFILKVISLPNNALSPGLALALHELDVQTI